MKRKKKKNKIGRNDLCPCGSGLKYKKCCMKRIYRDARLEKQVADASSGLYPVGLKPITRGDLHRLQEIDRITSSEQKV